MSQLSRLVLNYVKENFIDTQYESKLLKFLEKNGLRVNIINPRDNDYEIIVAPTNSKYTGIITSENEDKYEWAFEHGYRYVDESFDMSLLDDAEFSMVEETYASILEVSNGYFITIVPNGLSLYAKPKTQDDKILLSSWDESFSYYIPSEKLQEFFR